MRAGHVWFAVQGALSLAFLISLFVSRPAFPWPLRWGGLLLGLLAAALIVVSYRALGQNHSPWTEPLPGASLVTSGPYTVVRHPVYVGYILGCFGAALLFATPAGLVVAALTFAYYDLRTRWEDRDLRRVYPAFEEYRQRVRGRLLPGIY